MALIHQMSSRRSARRVVSNMDTHAERALPRGLDTLLLIGRGKAASVWQADCGKSDFC